MKKTLEELFKLNPIYLMGAGFDNALEYINHLIGLEVIEVPNGTKLETWTVPNEWIPKEAWVKYKGKKILEWKNDLTLMQGSKAIHGIVELEELKRHLHFSDDVHTATPYSYNFYKEDWGFSIPYEKYRDLKEGKYEVFIDAESKQGNLKIGVHTIKGTTDREILLFAHLDHPFQANDNLSGVVCLIDLAKKIKADHTIKIIFCPETIGSIAYATTQDISKVDAVIAVDICGNENTLLLQKSFVPSDLEKCAHLAIQCMAESFRKGVFRNTIGSDEYIFNDPKLEIPAIMFSRHPYKEYHTSDDTPDKINYEVIERTQKVILKTIEIFEKNFIPQRNFRGPLMRAPYNIQTENKQFNMSWDYLIYSMDGVKSLAELAADFGLNWDYLLEKIEEIEKDGLISRVDASEGALY